MAQVQRTPEVHDVVVIGSGAGGGTAVKVLTDLGMKVTLLEAGPMLNPNKDFKKHVAGRSTIALRRPERGKLFRQGHLSFRDIFCSNGYWDILGRTIHSRSRQFVPAGSDPASWVAGPTITAKFHFVSGLHFKPQAFDGLGTDWPMTYEDVAVVRQGRRFHRYYRYPSKASAARPMANSCRPLPPRVTSNSFNGAGKLNIPVIPSRIAPDESGSRSRRLPLLRPVRTRLSHRFRVHSSQAMIFPAMKTGRLNVINGAMARELLVDSAGKVNGVSYVDKATRTEKMIVKAVVVAASACESARLLLNSKSPSTRTESPTVPDRSAAI